ncbi:MAG: hypothetical protein M3P92_08460 [Actinomycetota bacterium]|nr:hypothetical protein [Actinomycetota bacterium]
MDFSDREIDFREADRRYVELKRQFDSGKISEEEFDAQYQELTVEDDAGRLWVKSRETGEWQYRDGRSWTPGTPPGYQPLQTPPAESVLDGRPRFEQDERSSSPRTPSPDGVPTQDREGGKQRRDVIYGAVLTLGILVAVGIMLWRFVPSAPDEVAAPPEQADSPKEASGTTPGYVLFEHESGALSVEIPVDWDERISQDQEGEKGRSSWSAFLGEGEFAGPSMTAVNDLNSWRTGTRGHQGVYMVASKTLAQEYTDDELVALGPNDYSSSCDAGTTQDLERPPYSIKMLKWENCGGDSDHRAITLAVAPPGRECVIVAQIGGYFLTQADEERIQHVMDTLETDCSKID